MMMTMMMMARTTMPRGPDLNLNIAPLPCNDSVREFLKQAMLQHEIAFRHQVRELHRLYWTQRNLMSQLRRRTMPNSKQVASAVGLSLDSPTPVNLELPADHECLERRSQLKTWQDEKKASKHFAVEVGSALVCGDVCNSGKSVASDRNEHNRRWQQQEEKTTHPYAEPRGFHGACSIDHSTLKSQSISSKLILIDLNETLDDEYSGAWHNPLSAIASSSSMNSTVVQCGASGKSHATAQQFTPFWRESINQCSEGTPVGVKSGSSRLALEYTRESNTINSFHGFQDSQMSAALDSTHNLETRTEDFTYQKQPGVVNLSQKSAFEALPDLQRKPTSESSGDILRRVRINVNGIVPSVSGSFAMDSKDTDVHGDGRKQAPALTPSDDIEGTNLHASVGSTNLPPTVSRGSEDKKKHNHEGSEEDTLSSRTIARGVEHQDTCSKEVPFVSKYELVVSVNNDSGSGDQRTQKHTVPFLAEVSGMTQTESLVSESYPNKQSPVAEGFDRCSVQIGSCNIGKPKCLDLAENDSFIFTAAEALVFISLGKPECLADQLSGFGHIELDADESEAPQCSSDSFESLTLMLPESKVDEYPLTPVIPALKAKENDACGVKLRRGRGLRDFQKDILPGLVSLSRHEICQDLHTIENVLRKCRTKTSVNWLIPVRNRRSRRLGTNNRC
ncbi:hypothetical protein DsansV1_C29g0213801 [Dioscorea sansibarensis]